MHLEPTQNNIPVYQQGITKLSRTMSNPSSLDRLLRIGHKSARIYAELNIALGSNIAVGTDKFSSQLKESSEILGVVHSVNLIQELSCPNQEGLYLFQRASWIKCSGKIFLLFYSLLSDIQLAEKFGWIGAAKSPVMAIGYLSLFKLTRIGSYGFYCASKAVEGARVKNWFKVALSVAKMVVVLLALSFAALHIKTPLYVVPLTGLSLTIDIVYMARILEFI